MVVYGYVKDVKYSGDGNMYVKVRIPNIHGPDRKSEYRGHPVRNYVNTENLPYYQANLLSSVPIYGDVVELRSPNENTTTLYVSGITGGNVQARFAEED